MGPGLRSISPALRRRTLSLSLLLDFFNFLVSENVSEVFSFLYVLLCFLVDPVLLAVFLLILLVLRHVLLKCLLLHVVAELCFFFVLLFMFLGTDVSSSDDVS